MPVITACPEDIYKDAGDSGIVTVTYQTPAATDNSGDVTVICEPQSCATFSVGRTVVSCVAIDGSGNNATCNFLVGITSD